jgi:hypothetical protein
MGKMLTVQLFAEVSVGGMYLQVSVFVQSWTSKTFICAVKGDPGATMQLENPNTMLLYR